MKVKTDLYTKIVLTIIAVALVGHLIKDISFVTKAQASTLPVSSAIETKEVIDVNIVEVNGRSIWSSSGIPVTVKNKVEIKE